MSREAWTSWEWLCIDHCKALTNTKSSKCPLFGKIVVRKQKILVHFYRIFKGKIFSVYKYLTFWAIKSTMNRARAKQPAAILAVVRFVDASTKAIPQNDEPRSGSKEQP